MVPVLVSFGTPQGVALLCVLSWRLFGFWLPIPASALTYLLLRAGPLRDSRDGGRNHTWRAVLDRAAASGP